MAIAPTPGPLSLVLTPTRADCPEGTLPDLEATLENTSAKPVKLCAYMLRYRLMLAMVAKDGDGLDYGLYPFHPGRFDTWRPSDARMLKPGERLTETLALSTAQGWGFVRTGDQPPLILPRHAIRGFPAGTATFSTLLFDSMAIYAGQDNAYDGTLTPRRIPEEIPNAKNAADVYKGDLRATATVRFVRR